MTTIRKVCGLSKPTRRELLSGVMSVAPAAGLVAVAAGGGVAHAMEASMKVLDTVETGAVAAATGNPDPELFALEHELIAAHVRMLEACKLANETAERSYTVRPPQPERPPLPEEYGRMYDTMTFGELVLLTKVQPRRPKSRPGPVPTLGQLASRASWVWV